MKALLKQYASLTCASWLLRQKKDRDTLMQGLLKRRSFIVMQQRLPTETAINEAAV